MEKELILLPAIFLLIGLIFQMVPVCLKIFRKKRKERCTAVTTATITGYVCRRDDTSYTYAPVYRYWANGQEYEKVSATSSSRRKHQAGDKVVLAYDSTNPKVIYVEEEQEVIKVISLIFHILGTVFMGVGMIIAIAFISAK